MTELYPANWTVYLDIGAIFFRLLGLFLVAPILSHRAIPTMFKVLFALSFSLALYGILKPHLHPLDLSIGGLLGMVVRESAIGLMMGFVASITYEAINLAAHFVGYQMGFGTASLMDPQNSSQVSTLVPLQGWLAVMVFWISDMHHDVMQVFTQSFQVTAHLTSWNMANVEVFQFYVAATAKLFWLAIRLAAPFTLLVLCCQVALGILSRMLPQMNLLLFSFPITILAGLAGLYLLAPEYLAYLEHIFAESTTEMMALVKAI
jgi:flagellar biosynthesis protein FliR